MRKLLLASVAVLGGTLALAGNAQAQWAGNSYTNPAGQAAVNGPGFATALPGYGAPLAPSTMTVHVGGRVQVYFGTASDSGRNMGSNKTAEWGIQQYSRIYPSVDAMAANGLQYGAALEIRQDNGAPAKAGASGAANSRGALYFRREYLYFGTPNLGYLRIGSTDQPTSLMLTGNFENFNDGGWNGDVPGLISGAAQAQWPFQDVGNLYTTNKFVYLSPQFFNLIDFGLSFEPGTANEGSNGNCSYAQPGCDLLSSTNSVADAARRRNTIEALARLRTSMGPMGVAATIAYDHSGKMGTTTGATPFKDQNFLDGGLVLSYGGLAVGGHATYGDYVPFYGSLPYKGARKSFAWLLGSSYAFGPAIVGVSYFQFQNAGAWSPANSGLVGRSQNEVGLAAGGTLNVAPGTVLYLSYLYGHRHQVGDNILTGSVGTLAGNNVRSQAIAVGTQVHW